MSGRERRKAVVMADKELRRLNRRELLQMLIIQCEEAERLQKEADEAKARLKELEESYERLKIKLNIKDERLNQKDEKIMELNGMIEEMQLTQVSALRESGVAVDAAMLLEGIFKMMQKSAGRYQTGSNENTSRYQVDAEENSLLLTASGDGHG